jgi:hypothetical protein
VQLTLSDLETILDKSEDLGEGLEGKLVTARNTLAGAYDRMKEQQLREGVEDLQEILPEDEWISWNDLQKEAAEQASMTRALVGRVVSHLIDKGVVLRKVEGGTTYIKAAT